jgi:SAM-dependent methyltransferase
VQKKTIKKLNQLNQDFYQTVAEDFNDSRQYFWQGWQKITQYLEKNLKNKKKIQVLDVGCGNARFAQFLKQEKINFDYFGLDNSSKLLTIAQQTLDQNQINGQLINLDLIHNYLKNQKINWPFNRQFNLIVAFGLTHHLPSLELRLNFFQSLNKILKKDGVLIVSNWQFAKDKRFAKNILNWQKIKNNSKINIANKIKLQYLLNNFEKNDFLMDWRKKDKNSSKKEFIRYCHFLDEKNAKNIFSKSNFQVTDQFLADGKSQTLNQYFVLKKAN